MMLHVLTEAGRSLREAFDMFWATLWALVLGFGLSGAVQAFVSRTEMQRRLGNHRPSAVARASLYGMVSSSCSYAASAMAKSMFARGADFIAAMVFMFASTNLVVELGIVLLVLIGWQFVAAEFFGGALMIVLLVLVGGLWLRGRTLSEARDVAEATTAGHDHHADLDELQHLPWQKRIRSVAGWTDAATYTVSDFTMLRRELAIGFVVAGLLTVVVPTHLWNDVFIHGHGFATTLENVLVGPFVAIVSFVCSIGNVPLAAALWKGGISFGGVVSFIFADLITLPLLLIYRKQYGRRMTLRMLGVFWLVMSLSGLVTEEIFRAFGWIPTTRPTIIAAGSFGANSTTALDIVAIAVLGVLYWLYRNRVRLGGGAGYAKDPVCGMQVETAHAPASVEHDGQRVYFCSEHCRDRFVKDPSRHVHFATDQVSGGHDSHDAGGAGLGSGEVDAALDPVCGMTVDPAHAAATRIVGGLQFCFCGLGCAEAFDREPARFARGASGLGV